MLCGTQNSLLEAWEVWVRLIDKPVDLGRRHPTHTNEEMLKETQLKRLVVQYSHNCSRGVSYWHGNPYIQFQKIYSFFPSFSSTAAFMF
jgi:hypothetical protein